jgi:hypothetical protein
MANRWEITTTPPVTKNTKLIIDMPAIEPNVSATPPKVTIPPLAMAILAVLINVKTRPIK